MRVIIDLLYLSALTVTSPYCAYKLLTSKKIRAGLKEKLGLVEPRTGAPCAWFHCVSVGEVNLARPLVNLFREEHPDTPVAVSTTTDTGRRTAEKNFPGIPLFYYPFDLSPAVKSTFRRVNPGCIILVELELWPNLLLTAFERGVPVVVVNGRITEKNHRRLRKARFVVSPLLKTVEKFSMQNQEYADRLIDLGVDPEKVVVTGNMKYDAVRSEIDAEHPAFKAIGSLGAGKTIVGGCTWPGEDEILISIYSQLKPSHPELRLVLAPRHPERLPAVQKFITDSGFGFQMLSVLKQQGGRADNNADIILVDTIGELDAVYAGGNLIFVGRSLTQHGGQNMLEPAALGKPVIFGPHTENFSDATDMLLNAEAAIRVDSEAALRECVVNFLNAPSIYVQIGSNARQSIERNRGAARKNLQLLEKIMAL